MRVSAETHRGHGCSDAVHCGFFCFLFLVEVVLGVFETESLIDLVLSEQARLVSQQTLQICLSLPSQPRITSKCHLLFEVGIILLMCVVLKLALQTQTQRQLPASSFVCLF